MRSFSEKTLIPVSLVIVLLGGSGWLTQLYFTQVAQAQVLSEVKDSLNELQKTYSSDRYSQQTEILEKLHGIERRLTRIESRLGID